MSNNHYWTFDENGNIVNHEGKSISFNKLWELMKNEHALSRVIPSNQIGEQLDHNSAVYINQHNGMFYKAVNKIGTPDQKQNVVGVYTFTHNEHRLVYSGLIVNYGKNLNPGATYYLSSIPGMTTINSDYKNIIVGRAINTTDLIIDIKGDVNINTNVNIYTIVSHGETAEGVSFRSNNTNDKLRFRKKPYDLANPAKIMIYSANGVTGKINFSPEYTGEQFTIITPNGKYEGTFKEHTDIDNPIILTAQGGDTTIPDPRAVIASFSVDPKDKNIKITTTDSVKTTITVTDNTNSVVFSRIVSNLNSINIDSGELPVFKDGIPYTCKVECLNSINKSFTTTAVDTYSAVVVLAPIVNIGQVNLDTKVITGTASNVNSVRCDIKTTSGSIIKTHTVSIAGGNWTIPNTVIPDFSPATTYNVEITGTNDKGETDIKTRLYTTASIVTPITYDTMLTNGETKEGISFTDPTGLGKFSFNKKPVDLFKPANIQWIATVKLDSQGSPVLVNNETVTDVVYKLDYGSEYDGDSFELIVGDKKFKGVFQQREDYDNPVHLTKV